ncbi:ferric uptake regulator, Fur family [Thermodesulfatator indicus DSM 15286]|uniref:Ferric uptake regulation protein n=1 Tax=Thermodesulfatator indicus (strain DSM 15286 / JCM 11887 / CIR29812) TaxID=667014 RepID=F8A8P6_THEID|nr:transcriptional repressor [Thermodesulfatator indicus]AEH45137.1 ferric uptake regulator, Fur family [Thermodesulfatator indicus DSM 15286]
MTKETQNYIHEKEREDFRRFLKELPLDKKKLLLNIFETFIETDEHLSSEKLAEKLKAKGFSVSLEEVEEALKFFCCLGFAQRKEFLGKPPVFEHRHLGEHHDHLICTNCGKIEEFYFPKLEETQNEIARLYGFKPLDHRLEIYGLCRECQARRKKPSLPLALVSPGEKVRVERLAGCGRAQGRLASMGLIEGDVLEVINNCGPIVVNVRGTRLAIGQGLAQKIFVTPVD